ncbi:MAG TPA: hypothetical protein V6C86_00255 [Oculatellaceae cyanobacterium]
MKYQRIFSILFLISTPLLSVMAASANPEMTEIGDFSPDNNAGLRFISINAQSEAKVNIKLGGSKSFASSNCPEIWFMRKSWVKPAYVFKELHGLKIRFTDANFQNSSLPDIHVYYDGKFWKTTRDALDPILKSNDTTKVAEIRDSAIWFDGSKLCKLPEQGIEGKWYSNSQLEVVLADDYRDELSIYLTGLSCECELPHWAGKQLIVHLYDNAKATLGEISVDKCHIRPTSSAAVQIMTLNCEELDACVRENSVLNIRGGRIKHASITEMSGGKANVSAEISKRDNKSIGVPNREPVIRWDGSKSPSLEFPSHGDFFIKEPGSS